MPACFSDGMACEKKLHADSGVSGMPTGRVPRIGGVQPVARDRRRVGTGLVAGESVVDPLVRDRLVQQRQRRRRDDAAGQQPATADPALGGVPFVSLTHKEDFDKSKP